ncbi:hypothetical protein MITS9509_00447 [Synechococcus sp. MIT S9509]|nr:hypothetical protein MITS9509_00447 [Synechococcus sp. MIT S9509]
MKTRADSQRLTSWLMSISPIAIADLTRSLLLEIDYTGRGDALSDSILARLQHLN